jgi:hypothetical protein
MKPGRELDILVAEKVMGLTHERAIELRFLHDQVGFIPLGAGYCYSTDIAAALEVVERVAYSRGEHWFAIEQGGDGWVAGWRYADACQDDPGWEILATAPTVAHAICLAALKAVGAL